MTAETQTDLEAALNALEARVNKVDPAKEIAPELRTLMTAVPDNSALRPRVLRLWGIVLNRLQMPDEALAFLGQAKAAAIAQENRVELIESGRQIALIHSWRGEDRDAALALLRAVAVAYLNDDDAATARMLSEAGRIELEAGRFDEAARVFRMVVAKTRQLLPARELFRVRINLCQALNRLEEHEEVLELTGALTKDLTEEDSRLIFLTLLEKARAYAGLKKFDQTKDSLNCARALLPQDESQFEHDEYRETEAELKLAQGEPSAVAELKSLAQKYTDPSLTVRASNLRIMSARVLFEQSNGAEAVELLADALRDAVKRGLPELARRIRSEMLESEGAKHLDAVLKNIDAIKPIGGEWSVDRQLIRLGPLGKGGGGSVYRAVDLRDGQEVAVKEISIAAYSPEKREQIIETVRNEYAVAVALPRHPGIAHVRGLLSDPDGTLYIVQELIKGTSLSKLYAPKPELWRLLPLLANVADALAMLHANHVVHRDVKPDNVMVRDGDSRAVLIDFGIALLDGQPDTLQRYGTAGYMAPEQARGDKVDGRADIYSLGRMIAQVFGSDQPPAASFKKLALFHRNAERREMPDPLAGVVRQMLANEPENRPDLPKVLSALEDCCRMLKH